MSARVRLALFAAALLAVFAAAAAVGAAVPEVHDDVDRHAARTVEHGDGHDEADDEADTRPEAARRGRGLDAVRGLAAVDGVVRLEVAHPVLTSAPASVTFRILDGDRVVTRPDPDRIGVRVHAVLVARDLGGFVHVHPAVGEKGLWTAHVGTLRPGVWRLITDVIVDGRAYTLGTDLFVPGPFTPAPPTAPLDIVVAGDVQVAVNRRGETITYRLTQGGRPLPDARALAAGAHLVIVRGGDAGLVPTEPAGDSSPGVVSFTARLGAPGRYWVFFEFQADGRRVLAAHTVEVTE